MLSEGERRFLAHRRIAHLATADSRAVPHVVPVCFAMSENTLYITIDEKPKRQSRHHAEALEEYRRESGGRRRRRSLRRGLGPARLGHAARTRPRS